MSRGQNSSRAACPPARQGTYGTTTRKLLRRHRLPHRALPLGRGISWRGLLNRRATPPMSLPQTAPFPCAPLPVRRVPSAGLVLLIVVQCFQALPYPQDDLLRNVTPYAWGVWIQRPVPLVPRRYPLRPLPRLRLGTRAGEPGRRSGRRGGAPQLAGAAALLAALLVPLRAGEDGVYRATVAVALVVATLVTSRLVGVQHDVWATV